MMGRRPEPQLELFCYLPEVPTTTLSRRLAEVQAAFDWEAVRARAEAYFAPAVGRPSLDPVVVVKLLLLHKLTGGPSWRGLVEFASDSLCSRRFLGYGQAEALPSHQALSDWRARLGPEFFEDLLVDVVEHCVRQGMVLSGVRVVDATAVKSQADHDGPVLELDPSRSEVEAWLAAAGCGPAEPDDEPPAGRSLSDTDTVTRPPRPTVQVVSQHDPEARLSRKPGQTKAFRYQVSYASDPLSQLIVSSVVKPTEEPVTALEHLDLDPGRPTVLVADAHYDTVAVHVGLAERGVTGAIPRQERDRHHGFDRRQFAYDEPSDTFRCPGGATLTRVGQGQDGKRQYRAPRAACSSCARQAWCTSAARRTVTVVAGDAQRAAALSEGPRYEALMDQRRTAEHLWRVAKRDFGMARADGLGLAQMRLSAALVACSIDLCKLLRWRERGQRPPSGPGRGQQRAVERRPAGRWRRWRAVRPVPQRVVGRSAAVGWRRRA